VILGTFKCNIFFPNSSTRLSCGEVTVNGPALKPPKVEWFMKVRDVESETLPTDSFPESLPTNLFIPLNSTKYWHHKEQLHLCHRGLKQYPHPKGPSSYDCSRKKILKDFTETYTCDFTSNDIIPMNYRCKISTFEAGNTYKIFKTKDILVKSR